MVALIQAIAIADRALGPASEGDMAILAAADPLLAEPAAGPEPTGLPGDVPDMEHPVELAGRDSACDPRLLRAMDERGRQLDASASDLAARARMLEAIEARAREQVRALQAERAALEGTLARIDREAESGIARLVEIYENMKPKEAARIFEAMPAEVAAGLVRRMAEKKSALVMGNLDAEHAYAITLALANSRARSAEP
jgi:flagellar motility protein MotE (MotC chaperone)